MGVNFVVENITGAGGLVGLDRLARAKPDGQTLAALNNSILTILPHLQPQNVKVDTLTEFEPIAGIANIPTFFAVPAQSSVTSIEELLQQARKDPERIHYASGGIGSPQHLAAEMFNAYAGVKLIHVPYRGASQATLAVASNEVQVMPMALSLAKPFLADKRIRLIGYCGTERHPQYPKIPTLIEQGIKNYDYSSWIALFAPKGISVAVLAELRKQTQSVVNDPAIQQKMSNAGLDPWPKSPEQLSKIMQHDFVKWQTIIKDANIKGG
jgi:tripartite-type tricarboxylate transporter receptor subunit TctC